MSETGQRNLLIMVWMGLGCQAAGVVLMLASVMKLSIGNPLGAVLFLIFGMALGGWAGNLREIGDLKQRVAELESRDVTQMSAAKES